MTRIAFVCQWYPPEPASVPQSIALGLAELGHEVTVVTGIPNYPDGRVKAGYRAWRPKRERIDGLSVVRAPLVPSHSRSAIGRMLNYLSWAISSALFGIRVMRNADVVLVYSSPATAGLGPYLWRRLARKPYVLLVQDMWPDSVTSSGMVSGARGAAIERVLSRAMARLYSEASHVVAISPGMADLIVTRGVDPTKVSVVYNWAPNETPVDNDQRLDARAEFGLGADQFVVTYAGNLGVAQNLEALIRHGAAQQPETTFWFVGDGVDRPRLAKLAEELGCANAVFQGRIHPSRMEKVHVSTDVHVVSLADEAVFDVTVPSKIQSILAVGKPLLVIARGDAARVVEDAKAGWTVNPSSPEDLGDRVREAAAMSSMDRCLLGERGQSFYFEHMSRSAGIAALDTILTKAAKGVVARG